MSRETTREDYFNSVKSIVTDLLTDLENEEDLVTE